MFECFFPKPRLFVLSGVVWAFLCLLFWFLVASDWADPLEIGDLLSRLGDERWFAGVMAELVGDKVGDPLGVASLFGWDATRVWLYQYNIICYIAFAAFWMRFSRHKWALWSVAGSALVIFATWFLVQLQVLLNEWFRTFFDLIQRALASPNAVTPSEYYGGLWQFLEIAMIFIFTAVVLAFLTSHYVFRWRTAMNDRYTDLWPQIRKIEGASQRIQEDTMRFASIMESLGTNFIQAIMTLLAFLPILWALSTSVSELPIIGEVSQALVIVAILWSVFGTGLVALAGYRLPGLEFRNQRVEAAFRKELVLGEDAVDRAQPLTLTQLFGNVRKNWFRLYLNYLYFNVARYGYIQFGVLVPYFALGPTIIAAGVTFGLLQQILNAFSRVEDSFQYLVNSWTTIVELMSIFKRLQAFERAIDGDAQAAIEFETDRPGGGATASP